MTIVSTMPKGINDKAQKAGAPHRFVPGDPRAGRPKGIPNKVTQEVRELAGNLLNDPEYLDNFRERMITGKLAPPVEQMIWHYHFGKPKETIEVTGVAGGPLQVLNLTTAERVAYLAQLVERARKPEDDWDEDDSKSLPAIEVEDLTDE